MAFLSSQLQVQLVVRLVYLELQVDRFLSLQKELLPFSHEILVRIQAEAPSALDAKIVFELILDLLEVAAVASGLLEPVLTHLLDASVAFNGVGESLAHENRF